MTKTRIEHHRPCYPDLYGQFRKAYHLEMISDRARTEALREGLLQALRPEMTFCELGCGTGLFSIFAAGRCRKVYAVEQDPHMVAVAQRNFEACRHASRIELIAADALEVKLPD